MPPAEPVFMKSGTAILMYFPGLVVASAVEVVESEE
jgi:hypothetical protein